MKRLINEMAEISREKMSYQRRKRSILHAKLWLQDQDQGGNHFLNVNNLLGRSCCKN